MTIRERIAEFFSVFDWMPKPKEVGDPREFDNIPIFFAGEYSVLKIALMFLFASLICFIAIIIRSYIVLAYGVPESGGTLSEILWVAVWAGMIGLLLIQAGSTLFGRKVTSAQYDVAVQWYDIIDELPVPKREMTKKELATYVNAAYKWEASRLEASRMQSIFNI